jgi:hypothetical protein
MVYPERFRRGILIFVEQEGQASVDRHIAAYEQLLRRMHDSRVVEAGGPVEQWNQMVDQLQEHHLVLRAHPEGRAGITHLVSHEVSTVRHWAATHALFWDEPIARAELERQASGQPSLAEFEAKMVLREFDAGRLNVTWIPQNTRR